MCGTGLLTENPEPPLDANYVEAEVGAYSLPDPLSFEDGSRVTSARAWFDRRRPEVLRLFEEHVFGRAPGEPAEAVVSLAAEDAHALQGKAIRRQLEIGFGRGAPKLNVLIYLPSLANEPSPVMLGPNFLGNHSVHPDPGIRLPHISFVAGMDVSLPEGRATEGSRGLQSDRWPIERFVERGYAVATFFYGDLFPDRADGRAFSIQPLFDGEKGGPYGWGAVATWSWAMSRVLDALQTMREVDTRRVALVGHSRHGKAALWAGALDRRFWLVVANNSGKGGASLGRRNFGETIRHLVTRYPHWFSAKYRRYADREPALPVDQHMLIALIAPRPVYVGSAEDDLWADPKGEFLGLLAAAPVYRLLGAEAMPVEEQPLPEAPVMTTTGYHLRRGGHGITAYDWERFLDFADRHRA
jgi:hypothetical protein